MKTNIFYGLITLTVVALAVPYVSDAATNSDGGALARARASLSRKKQAEEAENECKRKGPDSFCGIPFGEVVKSSMQRTKDGRYLTCLVQLEKPFKGIGIARVYAGVKTRRIFRVELNADGIFSGVIPPVAKRYGFEGEYLGRVGSDYDGYRWVFLNGDYILYESEYDTRLKERTIEPTLTCTNKKYKDIADREYEEESGGDGSAVL